MIDLNEVAPARPYKHFELDEIVRCLRATAEAWVPRHFPNGRRVVQTVPAQNRSQPVDTPAPARPGSEVVRIGVGVGGLR